MAHEINETPEFFLINEAGIEQKLDGKKIRLDYKSGARVTLEIIPERSKKEIIIRGYYGAEEFVQSDKFVVFTLRPGACNVVTLTPEVQIAS